MAFSDSIEATFLNSCYVVRRATTPDSAGNYGTTVTTIASDLLGDLQPARPGAVLYRQMAQGADYRITHTGFFDVPTTVPAVGDDLIQGTTTYAIRAASNWKDHLELELERLGV
jgi:hypothetical protein